MKISASIKSAHHSHQVELSTNDIFTELQIAPKENGSGSSVNGGELLMLSLATCFCNDLYREAAKSGFRIDCVDISVHGEFGGEGEPAKSIAYDVELKATGHSRAECEALIARVDALAEIHKTLRNGIDITLRTAHIEGKPE